MGYVYSNHGLCCDDCGRDHVQANCHAIIKYRCPFGYCKAVALCPDCRAKYPGDKWKAEHKENGCETNHARYMAEEAARKAVIDSGRELRCSALSHNHRADAGLPECKVIFKSKAGETAYWMTSETYRTIELGVAATPDDYRQHGTITPARNTEIYDSELLPAAAPDATPYTGNDMAGVISANPIETPAPDNLAFREMKPLQMAMFE